MMKTVFLAHSKSDNDLATLKAKVINALDRAPQAPGAALSFSVVLGRDHHAVNFARCGSWDAWCNDVATGIHPVKRTPMIDLFVVPEGPIGKATARILELALTVRKPVLMLREGGLVRARGIVTVDAKDYKAGWALHF
jgi:hypothetical protein